MTDDELLALLTDLESEKRRSRDLPFDVQPVIGAEVADLDLDFFRREYLPQALPRDILDQNQRTVEQQLASLRFATVESTPTVLGIIVLGESSGRQVKIEDDPHCLGLLKHYHSLMPMSHEARKPVFHLTSADGAIGAHQQAVTRAYDDFERLARRIDERLRAQPSGS